MTTVSTVGWGVGPWGSSPWGGAVGASLELVSALAVAENAVQLTFNMPVYFSGLFDPTDASQAQLYEVAPVAGSAGQDGAPARPVSAALVAQGADARTIILTLDRPMTPSPAAYQVQCSARIQNAAQTQSLNPSYGVATVLSVFKVLERPAPGAPTGVAGRDLASPDTLAAAQAAGVPLASTLTNLGVPVPDATGDYATDSGDAGLKKRILRRVFFIKGRTLHLGNYGASAPAYGKRLASAANRQQLASDCQQQIAQEPDVQSVAVTTVAGPLGSGLYYLSIAVKPTTGRAFKLTTPVPQAA